MQYMYRVKNLDDPPFFQLDQGLLSKTLSSAYLSTKPTYRKHTEQLQITHSVLLGWLIQKLLTTTPTMYNSKILARNTGVIAFSSDQFSLAARPISLIQ